MRSFSSRARLRATAFLGAAAAIAPAGGCAAYDDFTPYERADKVVEVIGETLEAVACIAGAVVYELAASGGSDAWID